MANAFRARGFRAYLFWGGLGLALTAGVAVAGTETASFGVSLRIAASCEIDSGPVLERHGRGVGRPDVRCALPTPRALTVTHEPAPAAIAGAETRSRGQVRVVTLTF